MANKCYVVPIQKSCNCDCVFCISKSREYNKNQSILKCNNKFKDNIKRLKEMGVTRFEITGGGEPFLNDNLRVLVDTIKDIIPNSYIKLYTNGFILKEAGNIDELDISLVSDDDNVNKKYMFNKVDVNLMDKLKYFRSIYPFIKLRLSVALLKGAIDTKEKLNNLINNTSCYVDEYVVRTLYPDTPFREALYVDFEYRHKKVIFERDNCACCFDGIILWSDNEFYSNWELKEKKEFSNKCYECNYVGE
jgi:MoaA/NifB/PqqE/SkfB family radical SAM enzyme